MFFSRTATGLFCLRERGRWGQRERHINGSIVASFAHLLTLDPFLRTVCFSCFSLFFTCGVLSTYVSRHGFLRSQVVPVVGWMASLDRFLVDGFHSCVPPLLFCSTRSAWEWERDGIDCQGSVVRWAGQDEGSPPSCAEVGSHPSPQHDGTVSEPPHQRETFECERFQQSKA